VTLRIAVSGAHCTGKTTFVRDLAVALQERGFAAVAVPEPIRALDKRLSGLTDLQRYLRLIGAHFDRLDCGDAEMAVFDRTLLDLLAYARVEGPDEPALVEMVVALLPWHLRQFDCHVLLPVEIPLQPDDRRPESPEYRMRVDRAFRTIVAHRTLDVIEVKGDREARVAALLPRVMERLRQDDDCE